MRRHEIADAWLALPEPRPPHAVAAELLGVSVGILTSALSRSRKDGYLDPSTVYGTAYHRNRSGVDVEAVLEDWEILRDADEHWERAAPRLGLTVAAFARLLEDARLRGDHRGQLTRDALLRSA